MSLVRLDHSNWSAYKADIDSIEAGSEYPLGNDFFKISHGANYLSFFERLGDVYYYGWFENRKVVAVAAGILRNLVIDGVHKRAWYLCDLKVHPGHRGRHIPLRLLSRAFPLNYLRCPRGYAISMNPTDGVRNRTTNLLARFRWLRFRPNEKLLIWSLDRLGIERAIPIIQKHRGQASFLSLSGIKDIVLRSTDKPMPLLHVQFGPMGSKGTLETKEGVTYMFCSPELDSLSSDIQTAGLKPSASATIISHRMKTIDWNWVLTSEI